MQCGWSSSKSVVFINSSMSSCVSVIRCSCWCFLFLCLNLFFFWFCPHHSPGRSHFTCRSSITLTTPFIIPPLIRLNSSSLLPFPLFLQSTCDTLRSHSDSLGFTPNMLPRHPTLGNFEEFACWHHQAVAGGVGGFLGDLTENCEIIYVFNRKRFECILNKKYSRFY